MKRFSFYLLIAGLLTTTGLALAQEESGVVLEAQAEVEVEVVNEKGETEIHRTKAALVTPGDEVIYTIRYVNAGEKPAEDVVITNPVPEHMACRTVEETPETILVTLSVDGGNTFDALENLTVLNEEGETRPADIADCTHVRWALAQALPPGESGQVSYRAVLE